MTELCFTGIAVTALLEKQRTSHSRYSGGIKPPDLNKSQSNSGGKKNEQTQNQSKRYQHGGCR